MFETSQFSDPGYPMSAVAMIPRGKAIYTADFETPTISVRHLLGYEPFVGLCITVGVEPREISTDVASFGDFVRSHRNAILDGDLRDASAVFLGNVLIGYRPDAQWFRYGDQFLSAGTDHQPYEVLHLLALLMDSDDATYRTCIELIEGWAQPHPAEPTL